MAKKTKKTEKKETNERVSTFQQMLNMMQQDPAPTKQELAEMIVENSIKKDYTIEAAKKTVPVRLNNLKGRGFKIETRLHEDGKYRYHLVGKEAPQEASEAIPETA